MRIAQVILVASMAVLATTWPARAKHAETQKTDDKSTAPACQAYQQAPDGSWQKLPCEEAGSGQTQHRPPPKASEDGSR